MERKLAAIFSADVKGYSRLMGDDEEATIRTLTSYREVMTSLIKEHRGRVVDSPGDNLLAEFASVVDAVQGAVEVQQRLKTLNSDLPDERRMEFRIGINLGDVIVEGERIYGDGVNIAARVESLAEAGGICISGTVYDQVRNKVDLAFDFLGEQEVKNIDVPVRVYQVEMAAQHIPAAAIASGPATVSTSATATAVADKPSIAILPFDNMSNDPEQEYFSDGITEDLITDLSKISGLLVIARNSSFTYKGKPIKIDQVAKELGVRYVMEGSVRKVGTKVRINAQLIDALTNYHLWADRFDGDLDDIFTLQDKITQTIVGELKVKLTSDEQERLEKPQTENLRAYDCYLRGMEAYRRGTKGSVEQAHVKFEQAIALDAQFATAYAMLGRCCWLAWASQWYTDTQLMDRAAELARKAIELDDASSLAHAVMSTAYLWQKEYDLAIEEGRKAVELDPNDADAAAQLSSAFNWSGRPKEALPLLEHALRLNPHFPNWYFLRLGCAYRMLGQFEESKTSLQRALTTDEQFLPAHLELAVLYAQQGKEEKARAEGEIILRLSPNSTLEASRQRFPYRNPADLHMYIDGLSIAGIPEG